MKISGIALKVLEKALRSLAWLAKLSLVHTQRRQMGVIINDCFLVLNVEVNKNSCFLLQEKRGWLVTGRTDSKQSF